jgi:tRNA dimethylallyltransferase
MFKLGILDETRAILDASVPRDASSLSSIGYAQAVRHLDGHLSLHKAVEETKIATRQLARRQLQWFRPADSRIRWVRDAQDIEMEANIFTGACATTVRGERSRGR